MNTDQLPLEASAQVELPLTADQAELFRGITDLQKLRQGSVVFCVLAGSYCHEAGRGVVRLQAALISRATSAKCLKLLRAEIAENAKHEE